MYPWAMKYGTFPLGQPKLVVFNELLRGTHHEFPWTVPTQNPFKGLILCKVLAPEAMTPPELPPLLPYFNERAKKLFFPLCAACSDAQNIAEPCTHCDEERSWLSAYTHLELNRALQLGYKILDVYEVEHYDEWSSRDGQDLFGNFIDACLKIKVQASGWPNGVETAEQRRQYIDDFHQAEGIQLDEAQIRVNPGLRGISKYLLNSVINLYITTFLNKIALFIFSHGENFVNK